MKEINRAFTRKQDKEIEVKRNGNFVSGTFPKRMKSAKKSAHFKGLKVSLIRADLHPDKILLFLRCQECQKCIKNSEPK